MIDQDQLEYFHVAGTDTDGNQAAKVLPAEHGNAPGAGADPAALSDPHTNQYRDFLDAIGQGRPPLVTVAEAGRSLAVVCAIYESVRVGKPVAVRGTA